MGSQNLYLLTREGTEGFSLLGWLLESVNIISISAACPLDPLCKESLALVHFHFILLPTDLLASRK